MDLSDIVKNLKKKYNSVSIGNAVSGPTEFISTGNLAFDLISDGGVPFGYVTEFLGKSQSGKSVFIHQIIANAQRDYDAIGILVDRENAYIPSRAEETLGIDGSGLLVVKPRDIPRVYDAFQFILDSISEVRKSDKERYIVVGIDSISAFGKDVDLGKADPGRKAKAVHEGLREVIPVIDERIVLIVANQVTYNVGVMFGDPRTTTAGESMKYYSTVRIALQDKKKIVDAVRGNEVVGAWLGIESIKTRLGPCYRTCYVPVYYKRGIDYYGGYDRLLVDRGYINPANKKEFLSFNRKTVVYKDKKYSDVEKLLEENPELLFDEYPEFNVSPCQGEDE